MKTFAVSTAKLWVYYDQSQLFDLQEKDNSQGILIENGCVN
jgi:hypothetical protein